MSIVADRAAQSVKLQWKCDQSLPMAAALTQTSLCKATLVLAPASAVQKHQARVTATATARCCWNAWKELSCSQPREAKLVLCILFLASPCGSESWIWPCTCSTAMMLFMSQNQTNTTGSRNLVNVLQIILQFSKNYPKMLRCNVCLCNAPTQCI